jgi:Fe-S-cluster containining protein
MKCKRCGLCCIRCGSKMYEMGHGKLFPKNDDLSKPCDQLRWIDKKATCVKYKTRPKACRHYPFGELCHLESYGHLKQ